MTFKCVDRMLPNSEANFVSKPNYSMSVKKTFKAKGQQKLNTSVRLNTFLLYQVLGAPNWALSLRTPKILAGF